MRTKVLGITRCVGLALLLSGVAWAAEDPAASQAAHAVSTPNTTTHMMGFALGFGLAIAAAMAAFSQSRAISAALEAVARQPEAGGRLQTMMLIGVVFIETLVIFTWVLFFLWGGEFSKWMGGGVPH